LLASPKIRILAPRACLSQVFSLMLEGRGAPSGPFSFERAISPT
jgi:hypothetical protein